jgi:hypothetical protein
MGEGRRQLRGAGDGEGVDTLAIGRRRRTATTKRARSKSVGDEQELGVCREYVEAFFAILSPSHLNPDGGSS